MSYRLHDRKQFVRERRVTLSRTLGRERRVRERWGYAVSPRPGLGFDRARDILWTLIAWEVYELLVIERGWSLDDWESWVAESSAALLLRDAGTKAAS